MPIVGALMAGGPSTSYRGGVQRWRAGFVAGGYLTRGPARRSISCRARRHYRSYRSQSACAQLSVADWAQLEYYADELEEVAVSTTTPEVGQTSGGDDDDWVRKLMW